MLYLLFWPLSGKEMSLHCFVGASQGNNYLQSPKQFNRGHYGNTFYVHMTKLFAADINQVDLKHLPVSLNHGLISNFFFLWISDVPKALPPLSFMVFIYKNRSFACKTLSHTDVSFISFLTHFLYVEATFCHVTLLLYKNFCQNFLPQVCKESISSVLRKCLFHFHYWK